MTGDVEALGEVLAGPGDPRRRDCIQAIAAAEVGAYLTGFLRRRGTQLAARSVGLEGIIQQALDRLTSWADVGLAFPAAAIVASLGADAADAVHVAAKIVGHFHGCGLEGTWRAEFMTPCSIRVGQAITTPARAVAVDGDRTACPRMMRPLGRAAFGERGYVLLAGSEDAEALDLDTTRPLVSGEVQRRLDEARAAIDLIRVGAPAYVEWCADAVRVLAAWPGHPERTNSASFPGHPGVIYISTPLHPVRVAESIVHEATHQYFHLAQSQTRLYTLGDEAEYWQPYVRAYRRIDRVLLAFHAFANVVLFHRQLLRAVPDDDVRQRAAHALEHHEPQVALLQRYLDGSTGLTPVGRSLCRTLANRLAA